MEHQIGIPGQLPYRNGGGLFVAWIDRNLEFSSIFRLQEANDPIVLELLTNRAEENWAQRDLRNRRKPAEYSMRFPPRLDD